jgi:hypothetical protein
MQTITKTFRLTILFLRDRDYMVAQCLEYDITAQGKNLEEAKNAFERTFAGQIVLDVKEGKEPLAGIAQAPAVYFELFKKADRLADSMPLYIPHEMPSPFSVNALAEDLRICA